MNTLQDLFEDTLRDVYYAEAAIVKALPKMAKAAGTKITSDIITRSYSIMSFGEVERLSFA